MSTPESNKSGFKSFAFSGIKFDPSSSFDNCSAGGNSWLKEEYARIKEREKRKK